MTAFIFIVRFIDIYAHISVRSTYFQSFIMNLIMKNNINCYIYIRSHAYALYKIISNLFEQKLENALCIFWTNTEYNSGLYLKRSEMPRGCPVFIISAFFILEYGKMENSGLDISVETVDSSEIFGCIVQCTHIEIRTCKYKMHSVF